MAARVPIAVLAGGRSPEHDVSLASARELTAAIRRSRWDPWLVRLDRERGVWWVCDEPAAEHSASGDPFESDGWRPVSPGSAVEWLRDECGVRIVFPALHGPVGEDGSVQGLLRVLDMPFVGSDVAASAVAMDKIRTRECLRAHDIPMAPAYVRGAQLSRASAADEARAAAAEVGFPAFAKADTSGSSIGVARVADEAELSDFLTDHRDLGRRFLVEAALEGEEISVPVLGNCGDELEVLPPVGIYPIGADHFTYESKYTTGRCEEVVPPRGLDERMIAQVQNLARGCHEALQCDGMSRTDMIVTAAGPYVLEVNTLPGFTQASLLPKSAAHHGIHFSALIDRLLELGLRRWTRRP